MLNPAFTLAVSFAIALCRPALALPIADATVDTKVSSNVCRIANLDYVDPDTALARFDRGELNADTSHSRETFRRLLQSCCDARAAAIIDSASAEASRIVHSTLSPLMPTVNVSPAAVLVPSMGLQHVTTSVNSPMVLAVTGSPPSATISTPSGFEVMVAPSVPHGSGSTLTIPTINKSIFDNLASAVTPSYYASASQAISVSVARPSTTPMVLSLGRLDLAHNSLLASTSSLAAGSDVSSYSANAPPPVPTPKLKISVPVQDVVSGAHVSVVPSSSAESFIAVSTVTASASELVSVSAGASPSSTLDIMTLVAGAVSNLDSILVMQSAAPSSMISSLPSTQPAFARPTAHGLANIGHPKPRPSAASAAEMTSASASASKPASVGAPASASSSTAMSTSNSIVPVTASSSTLASTLSPTSMPASSSGLVISSSSGPSSSSSYLESTPVPTTDATAAATSTPCNCDIEESQDVPVNDV